MREGGGRVMMESLIEPALQATILLHAGTISTCLAV
jgi:hypothetical protein